MARRSAETARPATILRRKGQGKGAPPITWQTARCEATATGWLFVLPVLGSANRLWRMGQGRTHKSAGAKQDVRAAHLRFGRAGPLSGEVCVSIRWVRKTRAGDVDNRVKPTLDLLRGLAYHDDAQVTRVEIERVDSHTEAPGLYVWIRPAGKQQAA